VNGDQNPEGVATALEFAANTIRFGTVPGIDRALVHATKGEKDAADQYVKGPLMLMAAELERRALQVRRFKES
jgi:hypothetical protein